MAWLVCWQVPGARGLAASASGRLGCGLLVVAGLPAVFTRLGGGRVTNRPVGSARSVPERALRAAVSCQIRDRRVGAAWKPVWWARWLCLVGRFGSPESDRPRARRSTSSTNGEALHLKPLPSSVAAGVRSEGSIVMSSRRVGDGFSYLLTPASEAAAAKW